MQEKNNALSALRGILSDGTVSYHAIFAKAFHSVPVGVYLSQMYFWQENSRFRSEKTHVEISGKTWLTLLAEKWQTETGLTVEQQMRAREVLREAGVLEEFKRGMPARLHQHMSLDGLVLALSRYLETGLPVIGKAQNKNWEKPRTGIGKSPEQELGKAQNTYRIESLESLESKEESGREIAPLPPAGEYFSFGAKKEKAPPVPPPPPISGPSLPEGFGGIDDCVRAVDDANDAAYWESPWGGPSDYAPPPVQVLTFAPPDVAYDTMPGGETLRAEVHAPAGRAVVIAKRPKPAPVKKTVEIPATHAALAPLLGELLGKRPYLLKTEDALRREMAWLFNHPVAYCAEHIQNSLDRSVGVWDSLKFSGCEETYVRWQRVQAQAQQQYNPRISQPSAAPYRLPANYNPNA